MLHERVIGEARKLGDNNLDTEHLLFALADDPEGLARTVLDELGVTYHQLAERINQRR